MTIDNLALACRRCNKFKSDLVETVDPLTGQPNRLYDPRRDEWNDHFVVDAPIGAIRGRTPIGRGTVVALRMDDELPRTARRYWVALGLFP